MKGYKTLSVPIPLYDEIEVFILSHPEFGYASVTEFFKESLRMRLREYMIYFDVMKKSRQLYEKK